MSKMRYKTLSWLASLGFALGVACSDPPQPPPQNPLPQTGPSAMPTTRPITLAPLPSAERVVSLFFTGDVEAHLEPCGCSKDPLGGVDRLAGYLAQARARPGFAGDLFLDGGDLLFEKSAISVDREAQIDKAGLMLRVWQSLGVSAVATGPRDLPKDGPDLASPALAVVPRLSAADPAKRRLRKDVGGISFGVFAAASAASGAPAAQDPLAAAKDDIAALKAEGATQIVALVYGDSSFVDQIAGLGGVHFLYHSTGDAERLAKNESDIPIPREKNGALILTSFSQGQAVAEVEFRIQGSDLSFEDGGKPARAQAKAEAVARRMEPIAKKIEEAKSKNQDASSLVPALEKLARDYEAAAKEAEAPISGSHFVARVTLLSSAIKGDAAIAQLKEEFVIQQGEKFKALAAKEVLPAPKAGEASYVGAEACADCHEEAMAFWKNTKHSIALETLVKAKRDGQPECIQCHVAGFRKPGGTTLVSRVNELGGVQCENCHGPGSLHIEALGNEKKPTIIAQPVESDCRGCHYPPHTNDFKFSERITKIVGPGHQFAKKTP